MQELLRYGIVYSVALRSILKKNSHPVISLLTFSTCLLALATFSIARNTKSDQPASALEMVTCNLNVDVEPQGGLCSGLLVDSGGRIVGTCVGSCTDSAFNLAEIASRSDSLIATLPHPAALQQLPEQVREVATASYQHLLEGTRALAWTADQIESFPARGAAIIDALPAPVPA